MTRLTQSYLSSIDLRQYDLELQRKVGKTLAQLTMEMSGLPLPLEDLQGESVAVVPVTAGKGLISGFSDAVSAVIKHLGLKTKVTSNTDIAGIGEAVSNGFSVLFCADDHLFMALDLHNGRHVDNAEATGEMYMFTADQMAGGMTGKKVLVIGLGKVGRSCVDFAVKKCAIVYINDIFTERCQDVNESYKNILVVCKDLEKACREADIIIDASPGAGFIRAEWLRDDVLVGAPGVPLGLADEAYNKFWSRVIHDPLPFGVAGMAAKIFGTRYLVNRR